MYRIGYVFCCCLFLLLTASCASNAAKGVAVSSVPEPKLISTQRPLEQTFETADTGNAPVETVPKVQKATRLLSDLTQAVENYDIHKALTLFGTIYELCDGQEDNDTLIDAYSRIQPILDIISIEAINKPAPVNVGSPFTQPFAARIVVTTPEKQFPLDNYPITVLYPSAGTGSRLKTERVRTDSDGFLYFTPPTPEKACDGTLSFCLFPKRKDTALTNTLGNLFVSFPYKVATTEKRIPSIIAILDYDENNTPVFSSNITAMRLLTGLMKRGFSRIGLDEYRELVETDEASVIRAAQTKIGSVVERLIFGKTHITVDRAEDNNAFTCTIQATISVWDFKQAQKIHQFSFEHTTEAKTAAQAISLARTDLGETIIAETLNYSL